MSNYEAMFILQPNLNEEQKKTLCAQLNEVVLKNQGEIVNSGIWSEKRKLAYTIKKFQEGIYYLMNFKVAPSAIIKLKQAYRLNENIVRLMILKTA